MRANPHYRTVSTRYQITLATYRFFNVIRCPTRSILLLMLVASSYSMGLFILISVLDLQVKFAEISKKRALPVATLRQIADVAQHHRDMYVEFLRKTRETTLLLIHLMNPMFGDAFEEFLKAHEVAAYTNTELIRKYTKRIERLERIEEKKE